MSFPNWESAVLEMSLNATASVTIIEMHLPIRLADSREEKSASEGVLAYLLAVETGGVDKIVALPGDGLTKGERSGNKTLRNTDTVK